MTPNMGGIHHEIDVEDDPVSPKAFQRLEIQDVDFGSAKLGNKVKQEINLKNLNNSGDFTNIAFKFKIDSDFSIKNLKPCETIAPSSDCKVEM